MSGPGNAGYHSAMKSSRRFRAAIKWTGAVVTVLLLTGWLASRWYVVSLYLMPTINLGFYRGNLHIGWDTPWSIIPNTCMGDLLWYPGPFRYEMGYSSPYNIYAGFNIPMWLVLPIAGLPTLWMFRTDRRRRRAEQINHCPKCGYSRTGLPADRACPECGTVKVSP